MRVRATAAVVVGLIATGMTALAPSSSAERPASVPAAPAPAPTAAASAPAPAAVEARLDPAGLAALDAAKAARTPAERKMASSLVAAVAPRSGLAAAAAGPEAAALAAAPGGRVTVDVTAMVDAALLDLVAGLGGTVVSSHPQYDALRATLPLAAVAALADAAQVRRIAPAEEPVIHRITAADLARVAARPAVAPSAGPDLPVTAAGGTSSEGDAVHLAATVRSAWNTAGQGVRIGILSDGTDGTPNTDDVPAVNVIPGQGGSGSEGRAMIEIVHDLAPRAEIWFATALGGQATMAANIAALAAAGCTVIVDDVTYLAETPFQDGIVAQAVNQVTAAGVTYVAAAGNWGRDSANTSGTWEGDFAGAAALPSGKIPMDFGGGDLGNTFSANVGEFVMLAWDDPAATSANDYDLLIIDGSGNVVASSTFVQDGNDLPYEIAQIPAGATAAAVVKSPTAADRHLRMQLTRGLFQWKTGGATYGHAAAADAIGVGATPAAARAGAGPAGPFPGPFTAANTPENFSADGPRRMFYAVDGTPLTPGNLTGTGGRLRNKPDLLGADGVSTTTAGFSPFYGTSAAAPHVAAIAALVRSSKPSLTAQQVRSLLLSSTIDLTSTPGTAAGWDAASGTGILMADKAVNATAPTLPDDFVPFVPQRILETRADVGQKGYSGAKPGAGQTVTLQVTGTGANAVPADATAVALNVTATGASAAGFVTVWPCDAPRPLASNLNLAPNDTRANLVVSKLSAAGTVCLYTLVPTDLVADVAGYLPRLARFVPLVPERLLETRPPNRVGYGGGTPSAGQTIQLQVAGAGTSHVPLEASAVVLNVTAVEAPAAGFVTVWPCDQARPTASNLNLVPGQTTPNLVVSKLGSTGVVCLFTQSGGHLLADIAGYFTPGAHGYAALNPTRILDTRIGLGAANAPAPGRTIELVVTGGAANVTADVKAVALNVTGTDVTIPGFVTVWPCGQPRPTASNLNLVGGQTRPNLVLTAVGAGGKVCLYTLQPASLVADLVGSFP